MFSIKSSLESSDNSDLLKNKLKYSTALDSDAQKCHCRRKSKDITPDASSSDESKNYFRKHNLATMTINGTEEKQNGIEKGRWSAREHELFLEGLKKHGRDWKKVSEKIPTRTSAQIRSHAQKYFSKISKNDEQLFPHQRHRIGDFVFDLTSSGARPLSSSALVKISEIIEDPESVQNEVLMTMKNLRERYQQLQQMIESRNDTISHHVQIDASDCPATRALEQELKQDKVIEKSLLDLHTKPLEDKELIALEVLGSSMNNRNNTLLSKFPLPTITMSSLHMTRKRKRE